MGAILIRILGAVLSFLSFLPFFSSFLLEIVDLALVMSCPVVINNVLIKSRMNLFFLSKFRKVIFLLLLSLDLFLSCLVLNCMLPAPRCLSSNGIKLIDENIVLVLFFVLYRWMKTARTTRYFYRFYVPHFTRTSFGYSVQISATAKSAPAPFCPCQNPTNWNS